MLTRTRSLYFCKLSNSKTPLILPFSWVYSLELILRVEAIELGSQWPQSPANIAVGSGGIKATSTSILQRNTRFCGNISSLTSKWNLSLWQRNNDMAGLISPADLWIFESKMQNFYREYQTYQMDISLIKAKRFRQLSIIKYLRRTKRLKWNHLRNPTYSQCNTK